LRRDAGRPISTDPAMAQCTALGDILTTLNGTVPATIL
jgi:hypothetical protein